MYYKAAILKINSQKIFQLYIFQVKIPKTIGILFSTIRRRNRSETCYFKQNRHVKIAFFREEWWKIDIRNDFFMILITDSERADPKTLRIFHQYSTFS